MDISRRRSPSVGAGNLTTALRALKGRRTRVVTVENSGPASLPGREKSLLVFPGGYAGLRHRLISVAPPGREIASLSLPAVSFGAALQRLPPIFDT